MRPELAAAGLLCFLTSHLSLSPGFTVHKRSMLQQVTIAKRRALHLLPTPTLDALCGWTTSGGLSAVLEAAVSEPLVQSCTQGANGRCRAPAPLPLTFEGGPPAPCCSSTLCAADCGGANGNQNGSSPRCQATQAAAHQGAGGGGAGPGAGAASFLFFQQVLAYLVCPLPNGLIQLAAYERARAAGALLCLTHRP